MLRNYLKYWNKTFLDFLHRSWEVALESDILKYKWIQWISIENVWINKKEITNLYWDWFKKDWIRIYEWTAFWSESKLLWRFIYSTEITKSELICLDTVNQCIEILNWEVHSENITEKWLWKKLLEDYFSDIKNKWIELSYISSSYTAIWFYRKVIMNLIDNWELNDFQLRNNRFVIRTMK